VTFSPPITYLITNGAISAANFDVAVEQTLNTLRRAVAEGVSLIQIREKSLSARLLYQLTRDTAAITKGSDTRLLVNDRADIAIAAGADGVHLTTESMPARVLRRTLPSGNLICVSAHSASDVAEARNAGADLAVLGPVFDSPGKKPAIGLDQFKKACLRVEGFPVVALGGVDESNWRSAISAGAAGFAAIRMLNDPDTMTRTMLSIRNEQRQAKR
jgi:thiamine-phosphate pyrophosphorylase